MAILDTQNKYSDGQAITATAASLNTIDQGARGAALEEPLWLVVRSKVSLDSATHAATLQVILQTADAVDGNNVPTGATLKKLISGDVLAVASLVAGATIFKAKLPPGLKRYHGLSYVVAGGENFNAGSVDAYLTPDAETVGQMLRPVLGQNQD